MRECIGRYDCVRVQYESLFSIAACSKYLSDFIRNAYLDVVRSSILYMLFVNSAVWNQHSMQPSTSKFRDGTPQRGTCTLNARRILSLDGHLALVHAFRLGLHIPTRNQGTEHTRYSQCVSFTDIEAAIQHRLCTF